MNRTGLRGAKKFQEILTGNTKIHQEALREQFLNPFGLKVNKDY